MKTHMDFLFEGQAQGDIAGQPVRRAETIEVDGIGYYAFGLSKAQHKLER